MLVLRFTGFVFYGWLICFFLFYVFLVEIIRLINFIMNNVFEVYWF